MGANNAGLCGDLVSVGSVSTAYSTGGTNLGNCCPCTCPPPPPRPPPPPPPPPPPTDAPTSSPTGTDRRPCCEKLRENPAW